MIKILLLVIFPTLSFAQLAPMIQYQEVSLDKQEIHSPSLGLLLKNKNEMFVGTYTNHKLENPPSYNYPQKFHSIDLLYEKNKEKGQWLSVLKSDSDKPISGGVNTFQSALVYGRRLSKSNNLSVILGGGLGIGNLGVERSNGKPWPLLPLPFFRLKYSGSWMNVGIDFITGPNLNFVIAPKNRFQLLGDLRMDQFRDERDLIFSLAFCYRFNDYAGISLGGKNDNLGAFELSRNYRDNLEIHYYAVFMELDFSLLKISAGHAFKGRELYQEEITKDLGHGYFYSIMAMIPI